MSPTGHPPKDGSEWVSTDYVTYSDDRGLNWTTQREVLPLVDEGALAHLGGGEVLPTMRHPDSERPGRAKKATSNRSKQ